MQNRTAIILSLGMLLEKVDTSGFIMKLLQKAEEENVDFVFTPEIQKQAFILSETFNLGKIEPEKLESQMLQLLGIKTMQSDEFWAAWDMMVTVGQIEEKIKLLQDACHQHHVLVYLYSDTNAIHRKKIAKECEDRKIPLDVTKQPMLFATFPLYLSHEIGKSRHELIKHVVADIQAKEINKPNTTLLILGNHENVKEKNHQAMVKKENDTITAWCNENNVSVKFHNNVLSETLEQIFSPKPEETSTNTATTSNAM